MGPYEFHFVPMRSWRSYPTPPIQFYRAATNKHASYQRLTLSSDPLAHSRNKSRSAKDSQPKRRSLIQSLHMINSPNQNLLWCLVLKILVDTFELLGSELGFEGGHLGSTCVRAFAGCRVDWMWTCRVGVLLRLYERKRQGSYIYIVAEDDEATR